jgi:hypothetical protein
MAPSLSAQESAWTLGGSLTGRMFGAAAENADVSYGSATTVETILKANGSSLRAEVSMEASVLTGSAAGAFAAALAYLPSDTLYAPADLAYPADEETVLALRVRTAYIKWNAPAFALTLGRQVVNYGKGAAWSPVDIFTKVDYSGLSLERRGSDAVRLTVPLNPLSLVEAVAAPAAEPANGGYALRIAGLTFGTLDGSLVGAWDGENSVWIMGGDAGIDFPSASIHADAAYSIPYEGNTGWLRTVAGFDTSFGDFVLLGEYYYNSGGSAADPLFPGEHNAYAVLTWDLADYHTLALSGLWDIEAEIFSIQTTWAWDLAQNGAMTAYVKAANGSFPTGAKAWAAQMGIQFVVNF